jgi:hypothetical protein
MVTQVEYSVAIRSGGQVTPCAIYTVHKEMRSVDFLVEPQTQCDEGFPSLGLKTGSYDLMIWALKSPRRFPGLGLKTGSYSLVI